MGLLGDVLDKILGTPTEHDDPYTCPYCGESTEYTLGGTPENFGYPSAKYECCGRVSFLYEDPDSGELLANMRIGDGQIEFMEREEFFDWLEEKGEKFKKNR